MKFGKTLLRNQIPEWSKNYLNYKALKKSINEAARNSPPLEEETTAIFFQLDRELEKVDTFYTYKQSQIDRRLWILTEKYNQYHPSASISTSTSTTHESASSEGEATLNGNDTSTVSSLPDIQEELVSALQETRAQMSKIMWFAELNAKGFRKILKKLDKKLGLDTQNVYWQTKVAVLPFASHEHIRTEIDKLNNWISTLAVADDRSLIREPTMRHPASVSVKLPMSSTIRRHNNLLSDQENEQCAMAIDQDDPIQLEKLLMNTFATVKSKADADQARYTLLELAVQSGSLECIEFLIKHGANPMEHYDINERNILHKLCILTGEARPEQQPSKVLATLLKWLPELSVQTDFAGRRPLHYASEFGQSETVRLLMQHAVQYGYYNDQGFADPKWQDREGHTPLFLAILHGNFQTLSVLIETGHIKDIDGVIAAASERQVNGVTNDNNDSIPEFARLSHHPSAVAMACGQSNLELLNLLIDKGAKVDLADEDGETALHIAVRTHFTEGVSALITRGHADVNLPEKINAWTPLIIAAMEGCQDIVEILLEAKADKAYKDNGGWAAYEHAVFRGHLEIGRITKPDVDLANYTFPASAISTTVAPGSQSPPTKAKTRAGRLYGHKYLTDQCMIIVKLGSNDVRNPLSQRFLKINDTQLDEQRLSISISAINATGELPILDLPPNNQQSLLHPEPLVLFATKPEDVVLRFDLLETFGSPQSDKIIARGTATFDTDLIYTKSRGFKGNATGNSSLRGQHTVPLVKAATLDYIGSLGFEYFVVTPFTHPKMTVGDRYTYYKSLDTKIIGHRGSGMNKRASRLQVGENTVLSFITAASLGAEYVEFDVQLTKDLVPVIYHDWTVTETGFDIPLNSITSEQFLNLRPSGHIREYHMGISDGNQDGEIVPTNNSVGNDIITAPPMDDFPMVDLNGSTFKPSQGKRVNRSNSLSAITSPKMNSRAVATHRLELTQTNKLGKLKGNGPESIQGPFTTLAEALKKIPKSAGCNIEVKYPMIDEAESDELHQFQEINIFVDTILECVYNNAEQDRRIIFSSFHPEICVALNLKQPNYPVFFLTDAGTLPMADVRCNSIQGAVRFAKQADLLGIVTASEPILDAPRMTTIIKESGLLLFTYGVLNNEVENAIAQKKYGVDAVIVDSVVAVRKGLRGEPQITSS